MLVLEAWWLFALIYACFPLNHNMYDNTIKQVPTTHAWQPITWSTWDCQGPWRKGVAQAQQTFVQRQIWRWDQRWTCFQPIWSNPGVHFSWTLRPVLLAKIGVIWGCIFCEGQTKKYADFLKNTLKNLLENTARFFGVQINGVFFWYTSQK